MNHSSGATIPQLKRTLVGNQRVYGPDFEIRHVDRQEPAHFLDTAKVPLRKTLKTLNPNCTRPHSDISISTCPSYPVVHVCVFQPKRKACSITNWQKLMIACPLKAMAVIGFCKYSVLSKSCAFCSNSPCLVFINFILIPFHSRIQVNRSHSLLKAVSDTSISTVRLVAVTTSSEWKGRQRETMESFKNSLSLVKSDSSYCARQFITTNSHR